jgi:hypothetical protein
MLIRRGRCGRFCCVHIARMRAQNHPGRSSASPSCRISSFAVRIIDRGRFVQPLLRRSSQFGVSRSPACFCRCRAMNAVTRMQIGAERSSPVATLSMTGSGVALSPVLGVRPGCHFRCALLLRGHPIIWKGASTPSEPRSREASAGNFFSPFDGSLRPADAGRFDGVSSSCRELHCTTCLCVALAWWLVHKHREHGRV